MTATVDDWVGLGVVVVLVVLLFLALVFPEHFG
jgi:hypothetical protein